MSGFAPPHLRLIARLCSGRLTLRLPTRLGSRFGATGLGARLDSTRLFAARFGAWLDAAGLFAPWLDLSRLALPWLNLPWLSATRLIARRQYHRPLAAIGLIRVIRVIRVLRVLRVLRMLGMIRMVRMLATPVATTVVAIIARLLRVSRLTRVAGPLWAIAHVRRRNDATAADVAAGHATARIVVCWTLTLARDEFLTRRPAATPILEDETGLRAERPHEHDPRTAVAAI